MKTLNMIATVWISSLLLSGPSSAQSTLARTNLKTMESTPCSQISRFLQTEDGFAGGLVRKPIHYSIGWWGRGFVEGTVFILGSPAVEKRVDDFGISAEVVAAYVATYCHDHPADTPFDAVQELTLKAMR